MQEQEIQQLLVPQKHQKAILSLAHSHLFGGHLGVEKTQARILRRFFWPGVHEDVRQYCTSCPECQLHSPRPHLWAPLIPLPITEVPFERLAMDLVGPLEKTARGHQHVLVVLDYATRYPEAVPLRNTASKTIAKELVQIFARVGLTKDLLTDQGTPFMSKLMKDLCSLLHVQALRTSVYHPQTDGLVEKFNRTLKAMTRKVVSWDGKGWDILLFAIGEVLQASTGFSPFELLYGHHPRGILDIAREAWEEEPNPRRNIVEHVLQMRDRIARVKPIVREHLERAQKTQRTHYNHQAKLQRFQPGDRVMVLVPTAESKLLAQWQGPYGIIKTVGEVNYKVRQPGRRKSEQIYHINLLKPWHDREACLVMQEALPQEDNLHEQVRISSNLTPIQKIETADVINRNQDVFSTKPAWTTETYHHIRTIPGAKVTLRPYRIPAAKREEIKAEVKKMLELGVIEESYSQWSSPIVLVPKPDGTMRFCNDFRRLNEISQFDAYLIPRINELVDRLGSARFLTTLDLTKGYWQIPLIKEAKEKTAFSTQMGYSSTPSSLLGYMGPQPHSSASWISCCAPILVMQLHT
ncbi:unnamed protein product [Lepidochelys olivacea]